MRPLLHGPGPVGRGGALNRGGSGVAILHSGARRAAEGRAALERLEGWEVRTAEGAGHAARLAREARAEGFRSLVAAGGDGTVNDVLNGLDGDFGDLVLGIVPVGSGNDLARSLGLPLDPEAAVDVVRQGSARRVDVGRAAVDGGVRYFLNAAVAGLGGRVTAEVPVAAKRWLGRFAYPLFVVSRLRDPPLHELTLRLDGAGARRERAFSVVVAGGRFLGGGIPVAPEASPHDGRFEVVVFRACPLPRAALLLLRTLRGRHLEGDGVLYRRASRVELDAEPPLWVSLDGETVGAGRAELEVLPGAVRVAAPTGSGSGTGGPGSARRRPRRPGCPPGSA